MIVRKGINHVLLLAYVFMVCFCLRAHVREVFLLDLTQPTAKTHSYSTADQSSLQ